MSRAAYLFAAGIIVSAAILLVIVPSQEDKRKAYEALLKEHPYNPDRLKREEWENIPKKDRPDLAWEQNFLMTMDPALGRPAPERLVETRNAVKSQFNSLLLATPGSAEAPWVERGPNNVGGRTRALMWDPNDEAGTKVWAGGVAGGLWYTTDIYDSEVGWVKVDDFWDNMAISSIAVDPTNTDIFYVGTGEGFFNADAVRGRGIWKTVDGGANWEFLTATNTSNFHYVQKIVITGEGTVLAATRNGLFRSGNGGESWSSVSVASTSSRAADIEMAIDGDIYVSFGIFNTGQVWKSEDDGVNFVDVSPDGSFERIELATAPSDGNVVYALAQEAGDYGVAGIFRTINGGTDWTAVSEPDDADPGITADDFSRGQAWYDLILAVDPLDEDVVLAGAIDLFKTTDGGTNWTQISHWYGLHPYPEVHADQHAIVFKPGSSTDVIFGHDGGVDVSQDMDLATPSFTNRNNGYNVTQFYAAAIHPDAGEDYFLAGAQDNGTQRFNSAGMNETFEVTGGDGAFCFIDADEPDVQISSYVYNTFFVSTNGGISFSEQHDDGGSGRFINPADYDSEQNVLYTATDNFSIGRFSVADGTMVRDDFEIELGAIASAFTVSPHTSASTTLFVGTSAGRLAKITNANGTPSPIEIGDESFPTGNISSIALGDSEQTILVTFSNYGVSSIWQSTDDGTSWEEKEGNLADMPVRWALYNPLNNDEVIIATELGIWQTANINALSPDWQPANEGLANTRVDMLRMRASDFEVIAATHGRGLYSNSGFASDALFANFSASATEVEPGTEVTFTDASTGGAVSWSWTFEGGTPSTSEEQNPVVTYNTNGVFDVSLTVADAEANEHTKTSTDYITVAPASAPNLVSFQPIGMSDVITIYNTSGVYANDINLSVDDDVYVSFGLSNNGNVNIVNSFGVSVQIDETVINEAWAFSAGSPFTQGTGYRASNYAFGQLSEGEHTVTITFDTSNAITETNEEDNVVSKTFYVQSSCAGEVVLTEASGTISDGSGPNDYFDNLDCSWRIEPLNAASISIDFSEFELEGCCDHVRIFDGNDLTSHLYSFNGTDLPEPIIVNSSSVVIEFYTDGSVKYGGWSLDYTSTQAFPDLQLSSLSTLTTETEIGVNVTLSNEGTADMQQGATVKIYISEDDSYSEDDVFLATMESTALGIGEEEELVGGGDVPSEITGGAYHLIIVGDPDESIEELDEENNSISSAINIPYLDIEPLSRSVGGEAGNTTFEVETDQVLELTDNADWLEVEYTDPTITATFLVNETGEQREGIITVSGASVAEQQIYVVQDDEVSFLTVTPDTRQVSEVGGSTSFTIETNISEFSALDDVDWLEATIQGFTVAATYSANTTINERTATITVTGTGIADQVVTVVQSGEPARLLATPVSKKVGAAAGSADFTVDTNLPDYAFADDADWLDVVKEGSTLTATYSENTGTAARTATITLSGEGVDDLLLTLEQDDEAAFLNVTPATASVGSASASTAFTVSTNLSEYAVSDNADWLTTTKNGSTVTATFDANTTSSSRTATLTFNAEGVASKETTVVQAGITLSLAVTPAIQEVGAEAGSITFTVETNLTEYTVTETATWATVSRSGNTVTASYDANTTVDPREAIITISGTGVASKEVTLKQSGIPKTLSVSPASREVNTAAGTTTFTVTSNITTYTFVSDSEWLTLTKVGNTITAAFTANTSTVARTANITFSADGVESKVVSVAQKGVTAFLSVSPVSQEVNGSGGIALFEVETNLEVFEVTEEEDWLEIAVAGSEIAASFLENLTPDTRVAVITVSGAGVTAVSVELSQLASPISGIPGWNQEAEIQLFPNPVNDVFTLRVAGVTDASLVKLSLTDLSGRQIAEFANEELSGGEIKVDLKELESGTYFVSLYDKENKLLGMKRFIKR